MIQGGRLPKLTAGVVCFADEVRRHPTSTMSHELHGLTPLSRGIPMVYTVGAHACVLACMHATVGVCREAECASAGFSGAVI
jgi:hypothetical protein